ncbi:hypothetical protein LG298_07495 [Cytobacillus firmus]|uniref:hypothetical protein n=1 Tax=Cytobacillus firmus TaxID=1399 RepID=UPI00384D3E63
MVKSHYMMGARLVIFIKGNEVNSPQVKNAVQDISFGVYNGKFADVLVIAEDNSTRIFEGRY